MIVRMVEGKLRSAVAFDELVALVSPVFARLEGKDGFLGWEVLRSYNPDDRIALVVVRWRDAAAISAVLGPEWETTLVPMPGEEAVLAGTPRLWHFRSEPAGAS